MKQLFLLVLLIVFSQVSALAQSSSTCPTIAITPDNSIPTDEIFNFKVIVSKDFDTSNLKYLWSVTNGKIVSGQGTSSLKVAFEKNVLDVSVEVQGLPANCISKASESMICDHCGLIMQPIIIDEFGKVTSAFEKKSLDNFANKLKNYPDAMVFITKSFTRNISKAAAYSDLQRILDYLHSREINKDRIVFGATYAKEELTTLSIIPPGVNFPSFDDEVLDAAKLAERIKASKVKPENKSTKQKFISH